MTRNIQTLVKAFAGRDTIPVDKADELIDILERANNNTLALLFQSRVKFCWAISHRILRGRGITL